MVVTLMGVFGTALDIDNTLWAAVIIGFASIAIAGLGPGFTRHRLPWPILVGGFGVVTISYAMYVQYDRLTEITGFLLLSIAAIWDWRICGAPASKIHPPEGS